MLVNKHLTTTEKEEIHFLKIIFSYCCLKSKLYIEKKLDDDAKIIISHQERESQQKKISQ